MRGKEEGKKKESTEIFRSKKNRGKYLTNLERRVIYKISHG
jgi:hypothetical protein